MLLVAPTGTSIPVIAYLKAVIETSRKVTHKSRPATYFGHSLSRRDVIQSKMSMASFSRLQLS